MKKILILTIAFMLIIVVSSYAVKVKTLSTTSLKNVIITIEKVDDEWTANVSVMGDVIDDTGGLDQQQHMYVNRKDLPAQVRAMLDNFLMHLAIEFNKQMADEDTNPLPPLN